VQPGSKVENLLSREMECDAAEAVVVSEKMPEAPSELSLQNEGTRDS
jgi:hypothetical protein